MGVTVVATPIYGAFCPIGGKMCLFTKHALIQARGVVRNPLRSSRESSTECHCSTPLDMQPPLRKLAGCGLSLGSSSLTYLSLGLHWYFCRGFYFLLGRDTIGCKCSYLAQDVSVDCTRLDAFGNLLEYDA